MKRIFAVFITVCLILLSFASCKSAEEYYEDKAIRVEVSHTAGFETYEEYDLYFKEIKKGEEYELPNGDNNPYEVDFTVTDISKKGLTITFSQPMDRINTENPDEWELEIVTFELSIGGRERFITPTNGGGDGFVFTIIDKADIPDGK